jgi:hypothetical protein
VVYEPDCCLAGGIRVWIETDAISHCSNTLDNSLPR